MPGVFDESWSAGPLGPLPLWYFSLTDAQSERNYVLARAGGLGGSEVFQVLGMMVQSGSTSGAPTPPAFRRTLFYRAGSRGIHGL